MLAPGATAAPKDNPQSIPTGAGGVASDLSSSSSSETYMAEKDKGGPGGLSSLSTGTQGAFNYFQQKLFRTFDLTQTMDIDGGALEISSSGR